MRLPGSPSARHIPGLSLLFLLLLSATTAAPVPLGPRTGRVTGHVRDQDGAPIASAQVLVVGTALASLTDSKGAYAIAAVAEGVIQLRAASIGYQSSQVSIT